MLRGYPYRACLASLSANFRKVGFAVPNHRPIVAIKLHLPFGRRLAFIPSAVHTTEALPCCVTPWAITASVAWWRHRQESSQLLLRR
jgi:hypothetical protein